MQDIIDEVAKFNSKSVREWESWELCNWYLTLNALTLAGAEAKVNVLAPDENKTHICVIKVGE